MKHLLLILSLVGCGKGSGSSGAKESIDKELVGTWKGACQDDDTTSTQYIMILTDTTALRSMTVYGNPGCVDAFSKIESEATYSIIDLDSSPHKINYTTTSITFTPIAQAMVDYINENNGYGYKTWEIKKAKSISGRGYANTDDALGTIGEVTYSVYNIKDGYLFRGNGDTLDGKTEATRPIVVVNDVDKLKKE